MGFQSFMVHISQANIPCSDRFRVFGFVGQDSVEQPEPKLSNGAAAF